jgi:hypothetical protein
VDPLIVGNGEHDEIHKEDAEEDSRSVSSISDADAEYEKHECEPSHKKILSVEGGG